MLTEKNFGAALKVMGFTEKSKGIYEKNFGVDVTMSADFNTKKLSYPKNLIVNRDTITNFSQNENFVVFECVNRLLDKGYKPEDIELEKLYKLVHEEKSGYADICVSLEGKTLLIIECKTAGDEYKHELSNMMTDGGQLFSYRQQDQACQWLELYASDFVDGKLKISATSVSCHEENYNSAKNVKEFFNIWSNTFKKQTAGDVIFHDETVSYKIGVPPFRKKFLI